MRICNVSGCARTGWAFARILFPRHGRLKLTLLYMFGLCFSISQIGEDMLIQVVGESITFSNPTKRGGTLAHNGDNIAVVVKEVLDSSYQDRFKDRIHWDNLSGQFTIKALKTNDSGTYVVDGKENGKTTYQLTVYEPVSRPTLTIKICSVECSIKNDRNVTLSWYSEEMILNQTSSPGHSIKLSLPLEVDVQNRTSYRCEAANPVTKENVTYSVPKFCMVKGIDNERAYWSLIAVMCLLVASVVVGFVIYRKMGRHGHSQDPSEREQADIQYAEISQIIPSSFQQELSNISELDLSSKTELTTVYEKLQFTVDSGDVKTA